MHTFFATSTVFLDSTCFSPASTIHLWVIDTIPDFISKIFPDAWKPHITDKDFYSILFKPYVNIHGNRYPALWNQRSRTLRGPASYSEAHLTDWLNLLSKVMGDARGTPSTRIWSHRSKDKPLVGSNIPRKPDLILIDKSYNTRLTTSNIVDTDCCRRGWGRRDEFGRRQL